MPVPGAAMSFAYERALLGALQCSPVGLALVGLDGRCLHVNESFARALGREPGALVDAPCVLTGEGAPLHEPLAGMRSGEDRAPVEFERQVDRPDGTRLWLLVIVSLAEGDDGAPEHLVVQTHDIDARKEAESVERSREALYRLAFEHANVGLGVLDDQTRFVLANRVLAEVHGLQPEDVIGMHAADLSPEDRREKLVRRSHENASDAGRASADMELAAHTVDGQEKWVSVNAAFVRDEDGKVRNVVTSSRDITRRKQAEAALRASEQRYRSLVEHLPVTVYSTTAAHPTQPVYVSPRIESLLGYTPEQLTGDPDLGADRLHPDDRDRVLAEHHRAAATGGKLLTEYRMIASDGRVVHVRQEGVVVPDDEGRPLYLHGYLQDITEQRRLEDQLRLAQKLESIGQLAAGIAHEINTPVQFVSDSVRFLQNGCGDLLELVDVYEELGTSPDPAAHARLDEAREYADLPYLRERLPAAFERTVEGLKRVGDIVRAMREFAHPHRGGQTPVDLNECLRNTLVVTSAQYKYVADVETSYGDIPATMADGGELNQVFVNLVVNAGHAIADVVRDTEGRGVIRVATRRDGENVVVTVADSGTGIPAEHRERIFDPFFTTKSVGQGTGQGLALVRTVICERHGGTIDVDSEPGAGTTFEIRLPVAGVAPAGADAPTAAARV